MKIGQSSKRGLQYLGSSHDKMQGTSLGDLKNAIKHRYQNDAVSEDYFVKKFQQGEDNPYKSQVCNLH